MCCIGTISQNKKYVYIVKLKFDMEDFNLGATWNVQQAIDLEKQEFDTLNLKSWIFCKLKLILFSFCKITEAKPIYSENLRIDASHQEQGTAMLGSTHNFQTKP